MTKRRDEEIVQEAMSERSWRGREAIVALGALSVILLLLAAYFGYKAYSNSRDQAEAGTTLAQQVAMACASPEGPPNELTGLCDDADEVVDSGEVVGIEGPQGPQGNPGVPGVQGAQGPPPSDGQINNAVALYCSNNQCRGEDGDNATPGQVAKAVSSYCDAQGQCRGPEGSDGSDGSDGAQGVQGPPPTTEQVASAVAGYCSTRNECKGPKGEPGEPGEPGQDGQDGQPGDTVDGGSCQFEGLGSIRITIQTSTGPTTFECVGTPGIGGGARE